MVGFQHSDDETSSGSVPHHPEPSTAALLDDVQFDPEGPGLEPRMQALSISNDALRDSLRPVSPPSITGWIKKRANPWWHHVDRGYTEALYWLWARAPWQRWALSGGTGALLGLAVVVTVAPRFRPEMESVASASGDGVVAATRVAAVSAVMIAPLRPSAEPPAPVDPAAMDPAAVDPAAVDPAPVDVVKSAEPTAVADEVKLPDPDAPSVVEVADQAVDEPAADSESPSKKGHGHGHGKRRAKPKSASSLSQLFLNMHHSRERAAH